MSEIVPEFVQPRAAVTALPNAVYAYTASAVGLGGVLKIRGQKVTIPSLASVALSPTGGEGSAVVDNYRDEYGISFTRIASRVAGYKTGPRTFTTYADVYITNLNLFDRLKIALAQATVISEREFLTSHPDDDSAPDLTRFEINVSYRGVEGAKGEYYAEKDFSVCTSRRYADFVGEIRRRINDDAVRSPEMKGRLLAELQTMETNRHTVYGSAIKKIENGDGRMRKNSVRVEGLGRIHLGEVLAKPDRRRVNLFRLQYNTLETGLEDDEMQMEPQFAQARLQPMGGNVEVAADQNGGDSGDLSGGNTNTNGSPIWPGP